MSAVGNMPKPIASRYYILTPYVGSRSLVQRQMSLKGPCVSNAR